MTPRIPLGQPPDHKLCENDALNLILDARDRVTEEWGHLNGSHSDAALLVLAKLTVSVYRLFYPLSLIEERDYLMAQHQEF